jgi:Tol biopolymer transport system component
VALDHDGSRAVTVPMPARGGFQSGPTFSPDGRRIAYAASLGDDIDIYSASAVGGGLQRLTSDGRSLAPIWGKPGIAFHRLTRKGGDVWLLPRETARPRRLTRTGEGIYPSAWSANGRALLAYNPAVHNGRLWAVDGRNGHARPLTGWVGDLFAQGLSRDGRTVLAAVGCGGLFSVRGFVEEIAFTGGAPQVLVRGPCRASWNL